MSMRNPVLLCADNGIIRATTARVTARRAGTASLDEYSGVALGFILGQAEAVEFLDAFRLWRLS